MKRLIVFILLLSAFASAAITYDSAFYLKNRGYHGSGNKQLDPLYLFINEVEGKLEAMTLEGGTTITFTNGATIDNVTDNKLEFNENSDELILTFGSNTVTASSTDVTTFSFGTIVLDLDKFKSNATTFTLPTADGTNGQVLSTNGSGTLAWAANGGGVADLDGAYNGGNTIDVDGSAVTLTVSDTDNNPVAIFAQNDSTNDPTAVQITSAADAANAIALDIDAQTTGRDIEGTGASWYVTGTGASTFASVTTTALTVTGGMTFGNGTNTIAINTSSWDVGSGGDVSGVTSIAMGGAITGLTSVTMTGSVTMATGQVIKGSSTTAETIALQVYDNDTGPGYKNAILLTNGNTPAIAIGDGNPTIALDSSTWDVSTLGAFMGVADITGTAGEALGITLAANGDADDLTISVTGAQNSSLLLQSAGTSNDAIAITTSAGGIDVTVAGAAANEDLDLTANTSVNITGAEADAAAIALSASNAAGGITVGFGTGNMVITGTGASADFTVDADLFSIDGTGTSNVTVTSTAGSEDFTIALAGAFDSSLILSSTGTAADAMQITASAGGIDVTSLDDLDLQVTSSTDAEDLKLTQIGANDSSITLTAAGTGTDAIGLQASAGGIDIDAANSVLTITNTANGDADDFTISVAGNTNSSLILTSAGSGTDALTLSTTANAGDIVVSSNDKIDMDAVGTYALNVAGDTLLIQVDSDGAADDLTLKVDGDDDSSIILDSDGTGDDAIGIVTTNGGINIAMSGGAASEDFEITTATSIDFSSSEVAADQFKMDATGAFAGNVINLETTDGGILLNADGAANGDITLNSEDDVILTVAGDLALNITGSVTGNIARTSQQYVQSIANCKVGTTAGWTVGAASNVSLATLPASQTASTLVIPITVPLKVGWTITAFSLNGQVDSAGNTATLDADLRKHTEVDTGYTDASIGAITQISKTADYKIVDSKASLAEVVAADESYYILVTATTAAVTDIEIASVTVTVSEI